MEAALRAPFDPQSRAQRLVHTVSTVLEGKPEVVRLSVATLLARGHLLVEDVPGVGKTTLARALARVLGVSFRRIQFTSDLLPADVIGANVFDQGTTTFSFRPGPIFTHVLLADEINRTTPRTQSALLEAMGERQVSIDGETRALEEPFFVVATQNPEDSYGTYPLPESQLDRFLLRIRIGYPPKEIERQIIRNRRDQDPVGRVEPVLTRHELLAVQRAVDEVRVDDLVLDYSHSLILRTRESPMLEQGASTRAALALDRLIRAHALIDGRNFATPDDLKAVAVAGLAHRVRLSGGQHAAGTSRADAEGVIRDLLASIPVPI